MLTKTVPPRILVRYAEQQCITDNEAALHFQELIIFLEISASTSERCAPSQELDKVWHCFLQFTREYREFCLEAFGCMIDHDPSPLEENVTAYLRTWSLAEKRFGTLDPVFWPAGTVGATMCGSTRCAL